MNEFLVPGQLVINPNQLDWGIGQVQSVVNHKITVNFEDVGKIVVDGHQVSLELYRGE